MSLSLSGLGHFNSDDDRSVFEIRPAAIIAWIFLLSFLDAPFWMYLMAIPSLVTYKVYFPPVGLLPLIILSPFLYVNHMILWMLVADIIGAPGWVYIVAIFAARGSIIDLVMWVIVCYLIGAPVWLYILGILT